MTTDLTPYTGLLDVTTGELLEPTVENAGRALVAARTMKQQIQEIVAEATAYLVDVAQHQGTKTLRDGKTEIVLTGGRTLEYDQTDLREALEAAGCPQERIDQAITATVTYKIDRSVLRQLAAASEDYRAAIELATTEIDKPWRATVK